MLNELNQTQAEICRWIDRLSQFIIAKEAEWGIGNLQEFCSAETSEKMHRQESKLAAAIDDQDVRAVQDLVNGTIRGYEIMEKEAKEAGYAPIFPEYMEVRLESGFTLRIAKNTTEARSLTEKGVYVWSLHEVARVIEKDYTLVNRLKDTLGAELKEIRDKPAFDFAKGDDIEI